MGEKNATKSGREKSEAEEERHFNMNVKSRLWLERGSHSFFVGQGWMDKLAVENAGALCVWRQKPDHEGDLQLKVKWKPERWRKDWHHQQRQREENHNLTWVRKRKGTVRGRSGEWSGSKKDIKLFSRKRVCASSQWRGSKILHQKQGII